MERRRGGFIGLGEFVNKTNGGKDVLSNHAPMTVEGQTITSHNFF